ncbi:MAG: cytochrome P450 [bacterium]|nr:cytochrome P450 [bacterium]
MNAQVQPACEPPLASEPLDITFESDALSTLVRMFEQCGDAFRVRSPTLQKDIWVLSHPEHVRHVLVDHHANFTKGIGIERVAILLGNGLMTSEGDHWRIQRKMVQPAFHRRIISTWMPHIHAANARLAQRWREAARNGATINVTQDMSDVTLDVVLRALFGDDLARLDLPNGESPFAMLTDETARNLAFAYKFRQLGKFIMDDVARRRRDGVRHNDIVSVLIDARDRQTGEPMTDRQLLDEILTLIVAGHETTASSLNWFWTLLAQAHNYRQRLHIELDAAAPGLPAYEDLDGFGLVQSGVAETLRMYPPGWLLTRRSIDASTIDAFNLPAGSDVLVSPYIVQRHPAFWPRPDVFDPDRFIHATPASHRFAFLPFGLGPRACIGEHLAMIEMHTHVAMLARQFELTLVDGQTIEIEPQVNLRTRHPVQMHVQERQG